MSVKQIEALCLIIVQLHVDYVSSQTQTCKLEVCLDVEDVDRKYRD